VRLDWFFSSEFLFDWYYILGFVSIMIKRTVQSKVKLCHELGRYFVNIDK